MDPEGSIESGSSRIRNTESYFFIVISPAASAELFEIVGTGTKDFPDIEFTGYPACLISGDSKSRIPEI